MEHVDMSRRDVDRRVVGTVLAMVDTPKGRSMLRRAADPNTEVSVYGHLGWCWEEDRWRRKPTVALAGIAGSFPTLRQCDDMSLGRLARLLIVRGGMSEHGVEMRLMAMQTQQLDGMVRMLRGFLRQATSAGLCVNWFGLYRLLCGWDHPNVERRRRIRRSVIEGFYRADGVAEPSKDDDEEMPQTGRGGAE